MANAGASGRSVSERLFALPRQYPPRTPHHVEPSGRLVWVAEYLPTPPDEIGVDISNTVHQLRAALDNVIWGALRDNGANSAVQRASSFPICASEAEYRRLLEASDEPCAPRPFLRDLPSDVEATIRNAQPFAAASHHPYRVHPLLTLRTLSNSDKHRFLLPVAAAGVGSGISINVPWSSEPQPVTRRDFLGRSRSPIELAPGPIAPGDVIATLDAPPDLPLSGTSVIVIDWVFGSDAPPDARGLYVTYTLIGMQTAVEAILDDLSALPAFVDSQ
ncbi:hypothetical protein ACWGR3_28890 [Streptomyces albidoflavus]